MKPDSFSIIFRLQVFHSYFEKGQCNCIEFSPKNSTHTLIKRFKFYMILNAGGFDFYSNTSQPISDLLKYLEQTMGKRYFEFDIRTNDPNFYLFTDFPLNTTEQLLFDSQSKQNRRKGSLLQLHGSLLKSDSSSQTSVLRIYFEDILKLQNGNHPADFKIEYKSRATQWQYYIINTSSVSVNHLKITGEEIIQFEGPESMVIPNGQHALLFSSGATLIPLKEIPQYKFNLTSTVMTTPSPVKRVSSSKVIFTGLPNPNPAQIGIIERNEKNEVTSPMYVYI